MSIALKKKTELIEIVKSLQEEVKNIRKRLNYYEQNKEDKQFEAVSMVIVDGNPKAFKVPFNLEEAIELPLAPTGITGMRRVPDASWRAQAYLNENLLRDHQTYTSKGEDNEVLKETTGA